MSRCFQEAKMGNPLLTLFFKSPTEAPEEGRLSPVFT